MFDINTMHINIFQDEFISCQKKKIISRMGEIG